MPRIDDVRHESDENLTKCIDETDVNYDFVGFAPRQEVAQYATLALAQAQPMWYLMRISKSVAGVTNIEQATRQYNQVWDDRLTITTWK